jgi:DNA-binding response OmpR family regulator
VARVLLVEDDRDIAEPLTRALAREGYDVAEAGDGRVALEGVLAAPPDLIILDVGLPGIDGLEVCRCVRDLHPQLPILMLTARDGELETVAGLDAGADDYVTKPFPLSVLLARIRAMLRRSAPPWLLVGDVCLDESSRRAWRADRELELAPKEFALLGLLLRGGEGRDARADHGRGLGCELVRLDQDAGHAHVLASAQAGRAAGDLDRARRRLSPRALMRPS